MLSSDEFQWGHDPEVMVSRHKRYSNRPSFAFQWGHDPEVMVRVMMMLGPPSLIVFQWGHDPEVMVSPIVGGIAPPSISRFNGATTRRSW